MSTYYLGPSAMEGKILLAFEDISARMMRRARCLHSSRYSTDTLANIKMLEDEKTQLISEHKNYIAHPKTQMHTPDFNATLTNINQLTRLWRWVALVEELCRLDQRDGEDIVNSNNSSLNFSSSHSGYMTEETWTARGLHDAGILKLLKMSSRDGPDDNTNWMDSKSTSDILLCDEYDSPMRR
jgi:hypothetical protein